MSTTLAFRTPPGAVSIPAGTSKNLGLVDVSPYSRIRVVADERTGSGSGINIRLSITEAGGEAVADLDVLNLSPRSSVTRVYEAPAAKLTVFADAFPGSGSDGVDVLIYGSN